MDSLRCPETAYLGMAIECAFFEETQRIWLLNVSSQMAIILTSDVSAGFVMINRLILSKCNGTNLLYLPVGDGITAIGKIAMHHTLTSNGEISLRV
jgi:hypothetical protein